MLEFFKKPHVTWMPEFQMVKLKTYTEAQKVIVNIEFTKNLEN